MRAALLLGALCAACGGDPTAPSISALTITPEAGVPPGGQIQVAANYDDPDGDLPGGKAAFGLRRDSEATGHTFDAPLAGDSTSQGRVVLDVTLPAGLVPGHYELALTLVDSGKRWSNALTGSLDVVE